MKITTRCGDDAVAGLNEALLAKAAAAKLLRTDKVRADTTVVEAAVGYPTDSGLLAKAVGTMARTVARIKAAGGATRTRARDRRRSAGRRARSIASKLRLRGAAAARSGPGRGAPDHRGTGRDRRSGHARGHRGDAQRPHARCAPRAGSAEAGCTGRSTTWTPWWDALERVVAQTRSRLAGVMPDSAHRLVSLHDVDARPIRKGRLGKPVEFGYKAQIVDNADGVILDHNVEIGNPADAPQLAPAIERITRRTGHSPRAVTADRGYGYASVERDLHSLGVRSVAIPRASKPGAARREFEHRRAFRDKVKWRTGSEGRINHLKRSYGWNRTELTSITRRPNLVRTWRLRPQPRQDQHPHSMKPITGRHAAPDLPLHPDRTTTGNPPGRRLTVFQVEVANAFTYAKRTRPGGARSRIGGEPRTWRPFHGRADGGVAMPGAPVRGTLNPAHARRRYCVRRTVQPGRPANASGQPVTARAVLR